jgi:hypothetical protein
MEENEVVVKGYTITGRANTVTQLFGIPNQCSWYFTLISLGFF